MFYSNSSYTPAYTRSTEFGVKHVYRFMSELPVLKSCRIERFCHISIILCKNDSSRFGLNGSIQREEWVFRNSTMVSYFPEPVLTIREPSDYEGTAREGKLEGLLPSVLTYDVICTP